MRFCILSNLIMIMSIMLSHESVAQIETKFGQATQVNYADSTGRESYQDMAVDSKGNLYIVWEAKSLTGSNTWLSIWCSSDTGISWQQLGYLYDPDADLLQPSIVVCEGTLSRVIVAYIVDKGNGYPYPEAAYAELGSSTFITMSLPYDPGSEHHTPEIWTDASQMNIWRAYIVCAEHKEQKYSSIVFWRSDPYGSNWQAKNIVMQGTSIEDWTRPHAAFGTPSKMSFVIAGPSIAGQGIYFVSTSDFGVTWTDPIWCAHRTGSPLKEYKFQQIAVARDHDNVMVCYTDRVNSYDKISYVVSLNKGTDWSTEKLVPNLGNLHHYGPELTADEFGGKGFHLTYTNNGVVYHQTCPQNFSADWEGPHIVCDDGYASHVDIKKGVACHPETDAAFICWSDTRDGLFDKDTFFNFSGSLISYEYKISAASGGYSLFYLYAGAENAGRTYLILGSVSGANPGIPLPGGKAILPINWDPFTDIMLGLINTPLLTNFFGNLDGTGNGFALLTLPPLDPAYVGVVMCFAYCVNNPFDFASNPIPVEIVN